MASVERIDVAPAVLAWARATAGYSPEAAAQRLNVKQERLNEWERGAISPTITQLRNMGNLYKRPLAVLLLDEPPTDFDAMRDFREETDEAWSPQLHAEYKRTLSQRDVMLELADIGSTDVPALTRRDFDLSVARDAGEAGELIRTFLGFDYLHPSVWSDPRRVLRLAIESLESKGILVAQSADVSIREMRGFSVSEWPYPVIVLNGSDWPRPRLFTLLHEICHVGLNAGGVCDLHEALGRETSESDQVERFCNAAAAAALMPAQPFALEALVISRAQSGFAWTLDNLTALSRRFGASSEAVLLRLIELGYATWDLYRTRKTELDQAYTEARERERQRQRENPGGPTFYTVKARNLGRAYVNSVIDAYENRAISSLDVADYLDVRFDQVRKLEEAAGQ